MDQNHVITMHQEVELMNTQMKNPAKLLHKSAGSRSCCIFRVPQSLVEINREEYQPRLISIGPYHYGNKDLEMIQQHKWRFLNDMITRTGKPLDSFMNIIVSMKDEIRECYSESIDHFSTNDLAKMMVLDGVFLIELFRKVGKLTSIHSDDPIFRMVWVSPFLMRDLLRIENQIPFFVLQKLFQASTTDHSPTLQSLILEFFNYSVNRPETVLKGYENLEGKHLLDFFRKSFINKNRNSIVSKATTNAFLTESIEYTELTTTKLVIAGVKFKANRQADSFLDIEFRNGLLLIPVISMDDFFISFFQNSVAFEQCYSYCSKDITTYVLFMGSLLNTSTDMSLLLESKIIKNYIGTDEEIAKFFNYAGKNVAFNIRDHYLLDLFIEVDKYCKRWDVVWAKFKYTHFKTYFNSPWAGISAFAAIILLSFTALQTFYTVYQYYSKNE